MDRLGNKDGVDLQVGTVNIDCEFTAGASGAVQTRSAWARGLGFVGCVLSATGVYTFTLSDGYVALLNWTVNIQQATYDATHGSKATLTSEAVASGTPTVVFQVRKDSDSSAVALTSGDKIKVTLRLQRIQPDTP